MLTLASARAADAGTYSCVAVSAVGEDRRDVVLLVHGKARAPPASLWGECGFLWVPHREQKGVPPHQHSRGSMRGT